MPETNRPNLQEVTKRYANINHIASGRFGEEGKRLKEEAGNIYSEAVDLIARTLLESKGENGRELLNETVANMFPSIGSTIRQEGDFFLAVAVRIAEIANNPRQ